MHLNYIILLILTFLNCASLLRLFLSTKIGAGAFCPQIEISFTR